MPSQGAAGVEESKDYTQGKIPKKGQKSYAALDMRNPGGASIIDL